MISASVRALPSRMNTADLIAIDTHTHLEVSCRNPFDNYGEEYDRAADKYFRSSKRPTMDETIAYYREKKIGFVNFTVDAETQMGRRRIPNEEIAEAAHQNSDIMARLLRDGDDPSRHLPCPSRQAPRPAQHAH